MSSAELINVGISACLLGQPVRYDGGHKLDHYIVNTLGRYFTWVPVCPEVEAGMGVPREAVHLEGTPGNVKLVGIKTHADWTIRMQRYARQRVTQLASLELSGFIFKSRSPSSGMERIKIYSEKGTVVGHGPGLFAHEVMQAFPLLPVEDEGRLNDPALRENFIERVFAFRRLQTLLKIRNSRRAIIEFHTLHKLLLMAHSPKHYQQLGRMVAEMPRGRSAPFLQDYAKVFMEAMKCQTTTKKHTNVLLHLLGYLKTTLPAPEKANLLNVIEDFRQGLLPVIVPITLLRHYIVAYHTPYLQNQLYLQPNPKELMLRNHT